MGFKDIKNISKTDVTGMSYDELKNLADVMFPVLNKRITRLEKAGLGGVPSITALKRARGLGESDNTPKFKKTEARNRNQLLSQVIMAQDFMNNRTSSVSATKKLSKDFWNRTGFDKAPVDEKEFWEEYRKWSEDSDTYINTLTSDFAVELLRKVYDNPIAWETFKTSSKMAKRMNDKLYEFAEDKNIEPITENIDDEYKEL